jgi:hypothetical protein
MMESENRKFRHESWRFCGQSASMKSIWAREKTTVTPQALSLANQ